MSRATKNAHLALSDKQLNTLALSYQCMEELPKIDFKKLAGLAGYTEGAAKFAWTEIKAKLKYMQDNGTTDTGSVHADGSVNTPKNVKNPAKNKAVKGEADSEETAPTTPAPRKRKATATPKTGGSEDGKATKKVRGGKAQKIKDEPIEDEVDKEENKEQEYEVAMTPGRGINKSEDEGDHSDAHDEV